MEKATIKRYWKKMLLFVLLAVCFVLYLFHSEQANLVKTPSTHSQIKWLDIDDAHWNNKCKIRYCLYDEECANIEICFVLPNRDSLFPDVPDMRFFVDGKEILEYIWSANERLNWCGNR